MKKINTLLTRMLFCLLSLSLVFSIYGVYKWIDFFPNRFKIGTSYMTMDNHFYKILNNEIATIIDRHNDILYTRNPALSVDKQCQQIQDFMAKKVDAIIINPVDSSSSKLIKVLKVAKNKGIKIIVVDSQLSDSRIADTTIVSDNYDAGALIAKDMMTRLRQAKIVLLEHEQTLSGRDRINGFLDTIKDNSNYDVIVRRQTLGQPELAMSQINEVISEGLSFDLIMALNDRSALGALAAVQSQKLSPPPYIYGIDGSPEIKSLIRISDDITATVGQSPIAIGKFAITSAYRLLEKKSVEDKQVVPVFLIDKDNINQYDVMGWQ